MLILRDLKSGQQGKSTTDTLESTEEKRSDESIDTIQRLCSVVDALCPHDLPKLVKMMCDYVSTGEEVRTCITKEMIKLAAQAAVSLEEGETRSNVFSDIVRCGGKHHLERRGRNVEATSHVHEKAFQRDLDAAVASIEA